MLLPNRHKETPEYRYGFQGQEMDDEVKGTTGSSVNYKFRMHDPRVGRFFAVDPLMYEYPYYTPYSFSGNKVIRYIEREGLEEYDPHSFDGWAFVGDESSPGIGDISKEELNKRNMTFASVVTAPLMAIKVVQVAFTGLAMGDFAMATNKSEEANKAEEAGNFQRAQVLRNEVGELSTAGVFEIFGAGFGYSLGKVVQAVKIARIGKNVFNTVEVPMENIQNLHGLKKSKGPLYVESLAQDMKTNGFHLDKTLPIEGVRLPDGRIAIFDGHHRVAAFKDLGSSTVPIRIRDYTEIPPEGLRLMLKIGEETGTFLPSQYPKGLSIPDLGVMENSMIDSQAKQFIKDNL